MDDTLNIYIIINAVNGNCYVGKTKLLPETRLKQHRGKAATGKTRLNKAFRCYGHEAFLIETLEKVDASRADERERYWISKLEPVYNMTQGGEGGDTSTSPNYRAAIAVRDQSGERNGMFGRTGSKSPNYGKRRNAEQIRNHVGGATESWVNNDERRHKASQRVLGFENNAGAQKMAKAVLFEGELYCSLAEASRRTGRSLQYIRKRGNIVDPSEHLD